MYQKNSEGVNLGTFGGHLPQAVKVIKVTNTVAVPYPYPVPFDKHVPFPVTVPKPIPYAVPQPIPVQVTKPVVIQQAVPFEVPKPYSVPQPYTITSPQQPQIGMSFPSGLLMAPRFHANQENDYQAYLNYNGGRPSISSSNPSFGQEQNFNVHELFGVQGGLGSQMSGFGSQGGAHAQSESGSQSGLSYLSALRFLGDFGSQSGSGSQGGVGSQSEFSYQSGVGSQSATVSQDGFASHGGFGTQGGVGSQGEFSYQGGVGPQSSLGSQGGFGTQDGLGSQYMFGSQNGFGFSEPSHGMFSASSPAKENASPMMTQSLYSSPSPMQIQYSMMFNQLKNEQRGNPEITFGHNFESTNSIDGQGDFSQLRGY